MGGIKESFAETERLFEEELEKAMYLLRQNREKVPEELLNTRYRKKYRQLKKDVAALAWEYGKIHMASGIFFKEEDRARVMEAVNRITAEGMFQIKICRAALDRQDMQEIRHLAKEYRRFVRDAVSPWQIKTGQAA